MFGYLFRPMLCFAVACSLIGTNELVGQDQSVAPGINKAFVKPNIAEFQGKFEVEGREAFEHRKEIIKACRISDGMTVADVGAGTGLFSYLFAPLVGSKGTVLAVDISEDFLRHIHDTAREQGLKNIRTVLCNQDSVALPDASVDLVFVCDTYHHFEFPAKTLASIHRALKPKGRLIIVDYQRIEGQSTEWVMGHVRAGLEVVEQEITDAGFKRVSELKDVLKENYLVEFERVDGAKPQPSK